MHEDMAHNSTKNILIRSLYGRLLKGGEELRSSCSCAGTRLDPKFVVEVAPLLSIEPLDRAEILEIVPINIPCDLNSVIFKKMLDSVAIILFLRSHGVPSISEHHLNFLDLVGYSVVGSRQDFAWLEMTQFPTIPLKVSLK